MDEEPSTAGAGRGAPAAFDLSVFDQRQWWRTRDGETHLIAELPADYRAEVIEWLTEHAVHFFTKVTAREVIAAARRGTGGARGELTADRPVLEAASRWWMANTALVEALAVESTA